jgi:two-component system, cell cycle sensor histidine kinase and response regulator CckA
VNLAVATCLIAASLNIGVGLLHLALARAPGWRFARLISAITVTAGAYSICGMVLCNPGLTDSVYLVFSRLAYLFATLHCAGWLLYAYLPAEDPGPPLPLWVRRVATVAIAAAPFAVLPHLVTRSEVAVVAAPINDVVYRYAVATPFGSVYVCGLLALLVVAAVRIYARWRDGERDLVWQLAAFAIFFACGVDELLIVLGAIHFFSLADFGALCVTLPLSLTSVRRMTRESTQLRVLSDHLAGEVARRTHERDRAQSALASTERDMQRLVGDLDAIVWESDAIAGQTIFVSDGARKLLGYSPEEWCSSAAFWASHLHPDDRDAAVFDEREAIRTARPIASEYRMIAADGSAIWLRDVVRPVTDATGRVVRLRGVLVDVSAARFAARALRESEQRFRTLFETASDGVVVIKDGRIVEANRRAAEIAGVAPADLVGRSANTFSAPTQNGVPAAIRLGEISTLAIAGKPQIFRWTHLRPDATEVATEITLNRFFLHGDAYLLANVRDITAQLALEAELRQAQKMEAVGLLAGGIAHDFNNLLTVINGYAGLLLQQLPPEDEAFESVTEIHSAGERAAGLTHQLLTFSRKHVTQMHPLDLSLLIAESSNMLHRMLGEDVILNANVGQSLSHVTGDPVHLQQVFMNLAVNARDAMPSGGSFSIDAVNVTLDAAFAAAHPGLAPGDYVRVTVSDTGAGMDAATLARIFDPFFTTKGLGRGTGLGLSTVYGIVRQHQGAISAASEPGRGTAFTIYLPRARDAAEVRQAARDLAGPLPPASGTILLVEDQEAVRHWEALVLRRLGYQVLEAAGGTEAIQIAQAHPDEIDLIVTDIVMPGMNGSELAGHLRPVLPNAGIIFISGYSAEMLSRRGVIDSSITYLPKPFSPQLLAAKVAEVLARPRALPRSEGE